MKLCILITCSYFYKFIFANIVGLSDSNYNFTIYVSFIFLRTFLSAHVPWLTESPFLNFMTSYSITWHSLVLTDWQKQKYWIFDGIYDTQDNLDLYDKWDHCYLFWCLQLHTGWAYMFLHDPIHSLIPAGLFIYAHRSLTGDNYRPMGEGSRSASDL